MAEAEATSSVGSSMGTGLTKKLGPLPVWMWGLLIGAAGWYAYSKGYFGGGSSTDTSSEATDEYGNPLPANNGEISGVGTPMYILGQDTTTTVGPTDNTDWLTNYALPQAEADGYAATSATTALNIYLNGGQLNADQTTMVNRVLAELSAQGINVPSPPTKVTTSAGGNNGLPAPILTKFRSSDKKSAKLQWSPVMGAYGYQVEVRSEGTVGSGAWTNWTQFATVNSKTLTYTIKPLQPSRSYQARVAATTQDGTVGTWSNAA